MAWPFKKKDVDIEEVPEEVQDYYEAERKQRASVAWMLAFFSLILTLAVATGAFYGGRAVYRRVKKNNQPEVAVQTPATSDQAETQPEVPAESEEPAPSSASFEPITPETQPQPSPTPTPEPQPTTPTTPAQPTPPQTPATGEATTNLPSTGPTNIVSIFAATSLISGLGYHVITKRRSTNN